MPQVTHGRKTGEAIVSHTANDEASLTAQPVWRVTNAPVASSRTDDIWFRDPLRGWAVNSNGQILHTEDGFVTWEEQFHDEDVYLRCVGFASDTRGWVGTLTADKRLFETFDGHTWTAVAGLPPLAPSAVCGMSVVNESVVYTSGTNFPNLPPRMMRTVDGGGSWQAWDMIPRRQRPQAQRSPAADHHHGSQRRRDADDQHLGSIRCARAPAARRTATRRRCADPRVGRHR